MIIVIITMAVMCRLRTWTTARQLLSLPFIYKANVRWSQVVVLLSYRTNIHPSSKIPLHSICKRRLSSMSARHFEEPLWLGMQLKIGLG